MRSTHIFISGGGDEYQTYHIDTAFFNTIPMNGRLLYIPTALYGHKLFTGAEKWLQSVLALHDRTDIIITTAWNLLDTNIFHNNYDGIYMGGGNTWLLLDELQKNNIDAYIKNQTYRGVIIYGGSAGAIILGKDIAHNPDEKVRTIENTQGLDLLGGYSITPHAHERLHNIDDTVKMIYLNEEEGAYISEGEVEIIS